MKRILTAIAVLAGGAAVAGPVWAANESGPPPGLQPDELQYVCDGGVVATVNGGNGRSGWINGEKWALVSIEATYEGDVVYSKAYGNGPGGETMDCSASTDYGLAVTLTAVKVQD